MTDKLGFAPLVRVSTEQQERMGESLRTQKGQIEAAVKALNGTLISGPWRYSREEQAVLIRLFATFGDGAGMIGGLN